MSPFKKMIAAILEQTPSNHKEKVEATKHKKNRIEDSTSSDPEAPSPRY